MAHQTKTLKPTRIKSEWAYPNPINLCKTADALQFTLKRSKHQMESIAEYDCVR